LEDEEHREAHDRQDNIDMHGNKVLPLDASGDPVRHSLSRGAIGLGAGCAVAGFATYAFYRLSTTKRDGFAGAVPDFADAAGLGGHDTHLQIAGGAK
jgi:hypothetical protein